MNDAVRKHLQAQADSWEGDARHAVREIEQYWRQLDQALERKHRADTFAGQFREALAEIEQVDRANKSITYVVPKGTRSVNFEKAPDVGTSINVVWTAR